MESFSLIQKWWSLHTLWMRTMCIVAILLPTSENEEFLNSIVFFASTAFHVAITQEFCRLWGLKFLLVTSSPRWKAFGELIITGILWDRGITSVEASYLWRSMVLLFPIWSSSSPSLFQNTAAITVESVKPFVTWFKRSPNRFLLRWVLQVQTQNGTTICVITNCCSEKSPVTRMFLL